MDCRDYEDQDLEDLLLEPERPEAIAFFTHAADCRSCGEALALHQSLDRTLKQSRASLGTHPAAGLLAAMHADPTALGEVREQELRQHLQRCAPCRDAYAAFGGLASEVRVSSGRKRSWRRLWLPLLVPAIAAAALAVLLFDSPRDPAPRSNSNPVAARPGPPERLVLLSEEELARLSLDSGTPTGSGWGRFSERADGPRLEIRQPVSPLRAGQPIPIDIRFLPSKDGSLPNMESLRVTYRKFLGIDLTKRLRPYLDGHALHVPEADLPAGDHEIEVYIEDARDKVTETLLRVSVEP